MQELPYRASERMRDHDEPRLVARTTLGENVDLVDGKEIGLVEDSKHDSSIEARSSIFKNAQWSPDGTTILTSSEDRTLRTFILPPELLEGPAPHILQPYSSHRAPAPIYATAIHPSFTLSDPSSALYIASPASLPIRLISPFSPSIISAYPLIHAPTEAYVTPHSLLFSSTNPNHFIAGSDSLLSIFDISRPSADPVVSLPTIPSKRKPQVGGGVGMKGIVSALALSCEGVLAAGTFTRWLGLYDSSGAGDALAVFPLASPYDEDPMDGQGATSLHWSSCGRYLAVAERGSAAIGIWDIRGTGRRLAWATGRKAMTMQRLGVTVRPPRRAPLSHDDEEASVDLPQDSPPGTGGDELWAGNTDGSVCVWSGMGLREGHVQPTWSFKAHEDAIGDVDLHPWGDVLATCSGSRHFEEWRSATGVDSDDEDEKHTVESRDRSLRIWAL